MSEQHRIRVLIVDDHAMVRQGLVMFLHAFDDLELVGEAACGAEALKLCATAQPDVVLMDLIMPGIGGIDGTRAIRTTYPHIQVIALTSFGKVSLVKAALQAGAIGYLLKNVSAKELAEAVRAAASGQPTLTKEVLQVLIDPVAEAAEHQFNLTESEWKVLELMCSGLNNTQIAERLSVGKSTIKTHVSNILSKLSVSNRVEAITLALQHGLNNSD